MQTIACLANKYQYKNMRSIKLKGLSGVFLFFTIILSVKLSKASDESFDLFGKLLNSLKSLSYVKEAVAQQPHKSKAIRISSSVAIQTIKKSNDSIGFEYNQRVRDILDFYTSADNIVSLRVMTGISNSYFPMFKEIFSEKGLPEELIYMSMALSALNPNTVNVWGASGLWQIMYTNGRLYRLQIDSYVDERRDPLKATKVAAEHLQDLYDVYKRWDLVVAAYINSPSSISKAIRMAGGSKKYSDLYPFLPKETRDFFPAFTACYILMNNYEAKGFIPYNINVPNFTIKEPVKQRLHLDPVALILDISPELLHEMNPEYKSKIIPDGTRGLTIKLPISQIPLFRELEDSIYSFSDSLFFPGILQLVAENDQKNNNNEDTQSVDTIPTDEEGRTLLSYTVKEGDNLGYIAVWYNVSVSDIRKWNNIRHDVIRVGQVMAIYVPDSRVDDYRNIDNMSFLEKQRFSRSTASSTSNKQQTASSSTVSYTWYTIKSGDNPSSIAANYPGVSAADIMRINNISNPRNLRPGQRIKIPKR